MEFFDLVAFFGIAAFFAWLGYAPLQSQRITGIAQEKRENARQNLSKITDYFLVSFLFYSITAMCDYMMHSTVFIGQRPYIFLAVGTSFLFGLLTLFVPMIYIRTIGRGGKDWGDINPPSFDHTVAVTFFAAVSIFLCAALFIQSQTNWGKILYASSAVCCCVAAILEMKYWYVKGWKFFAMLYALTNPLWLLIVLALFVKSYF